MGLVAVPADAERDRTRRMVVDSPPGTDSPTRRLEPLPHPGRTRVRQIEAGLGMDCPKATRPPGGPARLPHRMADHRRNAFGRTYDFDRRAVRGTARSGAPGDSVQVRQASQAADPRR